MRFEYFHLATPSRKFSKLTREIPIELFIQFHPTPQDLDNTIIPNNYRRNHFQLKIVLMVKFCCWVRSFLMTGHTLFGKVQWADLATFAEFLLSTQL